MLPTFRCIKLFLKGFSIIKFSGYSFSCFYIAIFFRFLIYFVAYFWLLGFRKLLHRLYNDHYYTRNILIFTKVFQFFEYFTLFFNLLHAFSGKWNHYVKYSVHIVWSMTFRSKAYGILSSIKCLLLLVLETAVISSLKREFTNIQLHTFWCARLCAFKLFHENLCFLTKFVSCYNFHQHSKALSLPLIVMKSAYFHVLKSYSNFHSTHFWLKNTH